MPAKKVPQIVPYLYQALAVLHPHAVRTQLRHRCLLEPSWDDAERQSLEREEVKVAPATKE